MPRSRRTLDLARVEDLAATGASMETIARILGVSPGTLYARKRENDDFAEAVQKGRARAEAEYAAALKEIALARDSSGEYVYDVKHRFQAIKFYLERRPGWLQKPEAEQDGAVQAIPTIKVKIEQAKARAEAAVTVEQEAPEALPEGGATLPEAGNG